GGEGEGGSGRFLLTTSGGVLTSDALVVATGGLSHPKLGASDFGLRLARQFGLGVIPPRPALVPFTLGEPLLSWAAPLAGASVPVAARCGDARYEGSLLFTHRGLSGPAMLQISSHWHPGEEVVVDWAPGVDLFAEWKSLKREVPRQLLSTVLGRYWPKRLAQVWGEADGRMADLPDARLRDLAQRLKAWPVVPQGTEGYRTAEVTVGGVDTAGLHPKTMAALTIPGLYFVGEVMDMTGELGGFNLHWAWASGHAAGQSV
ncbi:MAG: aminoacetone oxidase family FAD-binding enzyme, partial [Magnetococcales bacterium]|nr:aminoacetone oxidase family FAD-binding enzyme [Magnetococcales bacterium]